MSSACDSSSNTVCVSPAFQKTDFGMHASMYIIYIYIYVDLDNNMVRRWEGSVLSEALNNKMQDLQLLRCPCHVMDNNITRSAHKCYILFVCCRMFVVGLWCVSLSIARA